MTTLGDMDKFLETVNLSRLNHEEIENLNRPMLPNSFYETSITLIPKPNEHHKKLQANIPDEQRDKNAQQNISKPNSRIY